MTRWHGLLAEDEAPQREALRTQLARHWPELELLAVCEDGDAALEAAARLRPQVAFLDIRMPGASGMEVARQVASAGGLVVFTTAYDEYAVRAFEAGAVDYLLKPVQDARLQQAIARLRDRARPAAEELVARLERLSRQLGGPRPPTLRWITASVGDSVQLFDVDEVLYLQAQDKYVRVVTADAEAIVRTPLKELLAELDPQRFWQIHRGTVVQVAAIERLRRNELGKHEVQLRQRPERLAVSSAYVQRFRGM